MQFNTISFFLFFVLVTLVYFLVPNRLYWIWLLLAATFFYAAFAPAFTIVLGYTILVNYAAGVLIANAAPNRKRRYLAIGLISNLGVLGIFKYYDFLASNLSALTHIFHWNTLFPSLNLLLPIGLSFYTFQAISYLIEVYRGHLQPERHLGIFSTYLSFYPPLVAGPIERPQNLLPQFRQTHEFDYQRVTGGLKRMAWGLFKKAVIADRLAMLVNTVYGQPSAFPGIALMMATVFFALQIYCDFSGYSDIAIGAAQVMGFKLMENFRLPYWSTSFSEFWRRWHISLSNWVRTYLFFPLAQAGVRRIPPRYNRLTQLGVSVIVMTLLGLWHGAAWTFIVWGFMHGVFLGIEGWLRRRGSARSDSLRVEIVANTAKRILVFSLVCLTWIFFRANGLHEAVYILTHLLSGFRNVDLMRNSLVQLNLPQYILPVAAFGIMETIELLNQRPQTQAWFRARPALVRWTAYYALIFSILLFGVFAQSRFIYFQF